MLSVRCKRMFIFVFEGEPSSAETGILRTCCMQGLGVKPDLMDFLGEAVSLVDETHRLRNEVNDGVAPTTPAEHLRHSLRKLLGFFVSRGRWGQAVVILAPI